MIRDCLTLIDITGRLRHLFLDIVEQELSYLKIRDVTPIQLMMMYNLKADQIAVGSLVERGLYNGTNPSYNIKKLVAGGYVIQEKSSHDHRNTMIKLSQKGKDVCNKIDKAFSEHMSIVEQSRPLSLQKAKESMNILQDFWREAFEFEQEYMLRQYKRL